jgi:hypothetical protein
MKKPVSMFAFSVFIIVALIMLNSPIPVRAATQIYFTNFNSGYSDWTSTGTVTSVATPSIQPNAVR